MYFKHRHTHPRLVDFIVLPITNKENERHWTIILDKKREEQDYAGQEEFRSGIIKQCFCSFVTKVGMQALIVKFKDKKAPVNKYHSIIYFLLCTKQQK